MADTQERKQPTAGVNGNGPNDPTPVPTDPGGAHAKGYSADPAPEKAAPESDPVPLAAGPGKQPGVRVPERDKRVQPTGRSEPGDYTPNDRLMGSDR
jgi:hypothetical protein